LKKVLQAVANESMKKKTQEPTSQTGSLSSLSSKTSQLKGVPQSLLEKVSIKRTTNKRKEKEAAKLPENFR
jgi:hypothetical protein